MQSPLSAMASQTPAVRSASLGASSLGASTGAILLLSSVSGGRPNGAMRPFPSSINPRNPAAAPWSAPAAPTPPSRGLLDTLSLVRGPAPIVSAHAIDLQKSTLGANAPLPLSAFSLHGAAPRQHAGSLGRAFLMNVESALQESTVWENLRFVARSFVDAALVADLLPISLRSVATVPPAGPQPLARFFDNSPAYNAEFRRRARLSQENQLEARRQPYEYPVAAHASEKVAENTKSGIWSLLARVFQYLRSSIIGV